MNSRYRLWIESTLSYKAGDKKPDGYMDRIEWARAQMRAGLVQRQCACGLWIFPQERHVHQERDGEAMIPTLFLRASEKMIADMRDALPEFANQEVHALGVELPDLLVPTIRPELEYVLQGRGTWCTTCGVPENECKYDFHEKEMMPIRAFEMIAGEEGCVKNGQLFYRRLDPMNGPRLVDHRKGDAPWREAWQHCPKREDETHCEHWWDGTIPNARTREEKKSGTCCSCSLTDGPVWLVGPSVMGNFYGLKRHELRREREVELPLLMQPERNDYAAHGYIRDVILGRNLWGIEWRLGDEPVARVMRSDMGLEE